MCWHTLHNRGKKKLKNFLEQFNILSTDCVSVAGSGGKTTLLKQFATESISLNIPTIITTTTHVMVPFYSQSEIIIKLKENIPDLDKLNQQISNNLMVLISKEILPGKAAGLSFRQIEPLFNNFLLLIEADGSRCKPFKIPNNTEPVMYGNTNHAIIVCGLRAIGKPFNKEWVHRPELIEKQEKVTPDLAAKVISNPVHYLNKFPSNCNINIYLAGCNTNLKYSYALEIKKYLRRL